tara:strand:- start:1694 stop:2371 length:678 start_codon:yes stop_codon:yes gene_type:complete
MNLTNWNLSYPAQVIIISETLVLSFLLSSVFIAHFIYKPWLKRLEDEIEPEKYEDKYRYYDEDEYDLTNSKTNEKNFTMDYTPDGSVIMKYNEKDEGFEYWCDTKNIKYDYLDTVSRKYCLSYDCFGIYQDRRESLKKQKEQEKEELEEKIEKKEEESIFIKQKKIDTKKIDRSKGVVALKANKFIYKGKTNECYVFNKTRDDELVNNKTKKKMSFLDWKFGKSN